MDLEITGRGTQVTATLRQQTEEALARIETVLGPKCNAKVVLSCEKNHCEAEVTVRSTINDFSSHISAKEIAVALKEALDKVESQAVKARKKMVVTRHHPEHSGVGSIRLQEDSDANVQDQESEASKRLLQAKTDTGKAMAGMDDGALGVEQDAATV